MATAVALPVTVVLALLFTRDESSGGDHATTRPSVSATPGPVDVPAPPKSAAADRYCPAFVGALPVTLDGLHARVAHSPSPYVAAWGDPAVIVRCGVPKPAGFAATSELVVANGVQWYKGEGDGSFVLTVVDRPVYVELTVPRKYSGGALSEVTKAVAQTLPQRPLDVH